MHLDSGRPRGMSHLDQGFSGGKMFNVIATISLIKEFEDTGYRKVSVMTRAKVFTALVQSKASASHVQQHGQKQEAQ